MKKLVPILMVFLLCSVTNVGHAQTSAVRNIHVADGGLVFITDTIPVSSATEVVRIGFPSDSAKNLVGYYLLNENGKISVSVSDDSLSLEASPSTRWSGQTISIVTVWNNLLVEGTQGRYLLSIPANPIRPTEIKELQLSLTIDGTPSITTVSGVELTVSGDKRRASGTVTNIPQNQFKTLTVFFESPDLLRYVVEEAKVSVDLLTKTVTAELLLANLGDAEFNSVDLKLGKSATSFLAKSGIVNLGTSWDAEKGVLTVKLLQDIGKNEKVRFEVVYVSDDVFRKTGESVEIYPPNYLNASVSVYLLSVKSPPVTRISYSTEPWQLKMIDNNRREITFRFTNVFVTNRDTISLSYVETFDVPIPLILLVFLGFLAGFLAIRSTAQAVKRESSTLKQFRKTFEAAAEQLLAEVEKYRLEDKQKKVAKNVDELIRPLRAALSEMKKGLKTPEEMQVYSSLENTVEELSSTVQALSRLLEDYQSNRISKTVYRRIYGDYSKECRKILDQAFNAIDRAIQP